jgi:hypothetical protein
MFSCVVASVIALVASLAATAPANASSPSTPANGAPPVGHVWLIMLENHSFPENFGKPAQTFELGGGSPASMQYLAKTLPSQGALLTNYFGVAHPSNANYTALLSGQPPSFGFFSPTACPKTGIPSLGITFCTGTLLDCLYYTSFNLKRTTDTGVGVGQGCVYPFSIPDIGTQMRSATPALTVKAYQEDMPGPCTHPPIGGYDEAGATSDPAYETGSNPFLNFANWIDNPAQCAANDVPLNRNTFQPLVSDLGSVATTPNLSWIGLNLCDAGHDDCPSYYADRSNSSFFDNATVCAGAQPASEYCDAQSSWFLSQLIPKIMASPAYKQNGLIAIVWDEANFYTSSPYVDSRACCNESRQPGATGLPGISGQVHVPLYGTINVRPGTNRLLLGTQDTAAGVLASLELLFQHPSEALSMQPGGGDSGAILLSPFIKPGTVSNVAYNHFSLLATLQQIFGLPRTGNAADPAVGTLGSDVFNAVPSGLVSLGGPATGTLTLVRSARRIVGDGAILTVRCNGAPGQLCQGTATLAPANRGAPRVLAVRRYQQLVGPARSLTLYLSMPALRYLHGGRPVNAVLTLASQAGGATKRVSKTIRLRGSR